MVVTVRRLVKEGRQEKEARFPRFPVGLSDQGSQVGPALLEEVATPSDQATDTYGIEGNFMRPPRNILYAVGESKLANVGCPNGLKFPQILVNALEVKYA